jgi:hypothetical protein
MIALRPLWVAISPRRMYCAASRFEALIAASGSFLK